MERMLADKIDKIIEKMADCFCAEIDRGIENIDTHEAMCVADILKDLACAKKDCMESKYYWSIVEAMENGEPEDGDAYLDYAMKKFYRGRSATTGRFVHRKGYEMSPEDYKMYPPEMMRDMDRISGRMYYTEPMGAVANVEPIAKDPKEGKAGASRKTYIENKKFHSGNTAEDKKSNMDKLSAYLNDFGADLKEMWDGMLPEEKTLAKQKMSNIVTSL